MDSLYTEDYVDNPITFFINGCLKITKNTVKTDVDATNRYIMRFLTETSKKIQIRISFWDDNDNATEHIQTVEGLQVIKVDCTDYMEKFNWQNKTYMKLNYIVDLNDNPVFRGSFPLISPSSDHNLKFCSVSNNSYLSTETSTLWNDMSKKNCDILLHTGGQIDGSYIVDNRVGCNGNSCESDVIYDNYATLYRRAYSDVSQSNVMRNCLNVTVLGDKDVCSNFATRGTWKVKDSTSVFTAYYLEAMATFLKYQFQLHTDIFTEDQETTDLNSRFYHILNGRHPVHYSLQYGKYLLLMIDHKHDLYHKDEIFSDAQLYWLQYTLTTSKSSNILLVMPKAVGELNKLNCFLNGLFCLSSRDELFHPQNYDRTLEFLETLKSSKKSDNLYYLVTGGKYSYINSVNSKDKDTGVIKLIADQLVSGSITDISVKSSKSTTKLNFWVQQKFLMYVMDSVNISSKKNLCTNNSFGTIEDDRLSTHCAECSYVNSINTSSLMCNSFYV